MSDTKMVVKKIKQGMVIPEGSEQQDSCIEIATNKQYATEFWGDYCILCAKQMCSCLSNTFV